MINVLFICHGNICRSPMAEFVFKDLVWKSGLPKGMIGEISSAATSTEEIGNGVYPPARQVLAEHGISCNGKTARQVNRSDYERYTHIVGMDRTNMRNLKFLFGGDPDGKCSLLLDHLPKGHPDFGRDVADPWYTGNFNRTWDDVLMGCKALLTELVLRRKEWGATDGK